MTQRELKVEKWRRWMVCL